MASFQFQAHLLPLSLSEAERDDDGVAEKTIGLFNGEFFQSHSASRFLTTQVRDCPGCGTPDWLWNIVRADDRVQGYRSNILLVPLRA